MAEFQIKKSDEWKGTSLCEAVLLTIEELNIFHNKHQSSKCPRGDYFGPNGYIASQADIDDALKNHPNQNGSYGTYQCLELFKRDHLIVEIGTGHYLMK